MQYLKTKVLAPEFDPNNFPPLGPDVLQYSGLSYYFAECNLFRGDDPNELVEDYYLIHSSSMSGLAARLATKNTDLDKHVAVFADDIPELVSDNRKYIFPLRPEYYHLLIDNLSCVFKLYSYDSEATFFFGDPCISGDTDARLRELNKNLEFIKLVLEKNNIKLQTYKSPYSKQDSTEYYIYRTNNGVLVHDALNSINLSLKDIVTNYNRFVLDKLCKPRKPTRKVYISRKSLVKVVNSSASDNLRIHDEDLIEQYLKSKGFEILRPETLGTIKEQVQLLSETKVLIGVTGSGLINQLFMQDGGTVIELKLEERFAPGIQESLRFYADFAYAKSHAYVGLDVSDRKAETAIEKLDALFERFLLT